MTNNSPDLSYLRKTTLLPLNLPERIISTVPGVMFFLSLVGLTFFYLLLKWVLMSSAGYHFGIAIERYLGFKFIKFVNVIN